MQALLSAYLPILIFLGIAVALAALLVGASYIVAHQKPDSDKLAAYECGFEPFEDARGKFDVRFYLVAILFIVFDVEAVFLFPWAVNFRSLGLFGLVEMFTFIGVLLAGFVYIVKKGALKWD
jgi:NADH-quinone oxidoreductase subunit A